MKLREVLIHVAVERGVELDPAWSTLDELVPLLESVMADEGVVLVQLGGAAGGRRAETIVLGGRMGSSQVQTDGDSVVEATARALVSYAMAVPGDPVARERTGPIAPTWSSFADVEAVLHELVQDGATVTLKLDGQRRSGWFDVIVSDGTLGASTRRTSGETLLDAARRARETYARGVS
jgi:hypothetical protein